ncbi:MAG: Lrp/AsnC family transcriptional regulator [Clostridiaceae bacterium]|nr:Lrp/AsnC family transcriptional regulator [Clostridiaceae bacterium]
MNQLDKELLTMIQKDFPIVERPYKYIANELQLTEKEVINRIKNLKEEGIIRRLGGVFDSRKLGYYSTLCAIKVPKEDLDEVATIINKIPGVTHNYLRNHQYNMWFTLIGPSEEYIQETLEEIKRKSGIEDLMNLPSKNFFKVEVKFNLMEV